MTESAEVGPVEEDGGYDPFEDMHVAAKESCPTAELQGND